MVLVDPASPTELSAWALAWIAALGLVGAAAWRLWGRVTTAIRRWLVDAADQRIKDLEAALAALRVERDRDREDLVARDHAIIRHLAWDHQVITLLAAAGHQDIPEAPPLWPDQAG